MTDKAVLGKAQDMTRNKGKRLSLYVKDYVVFDLETTGLNPAEDAIIEISGIKVRGSRAVEEFSTLVNPGMPIPSAATRVNGITDEMVTEAPGLETAVAGFLDFAGTDILIGHNIHTFDTNFLYDAAWRELGRAVKNDYIDTLYMAKSCLPQLSHHKLTDVAAFFGIETKGAHRALFDCHMNRQCYEKLGVLWEEKSKEGSAEEAVCPECGCLLVKRRGKYGDFFGCSGFPLCRYTKKVGK